MSKKAAPLEEVPSQALTLTPGKVLQKERIAQKKSLKTVAAELCINERYLSALEEMKFSQLPERVYTLGFVGSYAQYLKLNPTLLADQFGKDLGHIPVYQSPISHEISPKIRPNWYHLLLAIAALGVAFFLWETFSSAPPAPSNTIDMPDLPEELPVSVTAPKAITKPPASSIDPLSIDTSSLPSSSSAQENTSEVAWAAETPSQPQEPQSNAPFIFKAIEKVWIELKDDSGKVVYTKTLLPGDTYTFSPETNSTLTTGNAGGLEIHKGDQRYAVVGKSGDVKRNIPLNLSASQSQTEGLILSLE